MRLGASTNCGGLVSCFRVTDSVVCCRPERWECLPEGVNSRIVLEYANVSEREPTSWESGLYWIQVCVVSYYC